MINEVAVPRKTSTTSERVVDDGSVWALISTNVFVLGLALLLDWRLVDMMLVFWLQSVAIGVSYFLRILALKSFSTKDFRVGGKAVEPTTSVKIRTAFFFLVHFGIFHVAYLGFILAGDFGEPRLGLDLMIGGAAFAANHAYSYRYHRDRDRQGAPNIGSLMATPYLRVIPMHMTIIFGSVISTGAGVLLFGVLKTIADALMHQAEHRIIGPRD